MTTPLRKALAALVAVPLSLAQFMVAVAPAAAADTATVPDPIASYPLENDADDSSANKLNGEAKGVTFADGEGATFDGGKSGDAEYIKLPDELAARFRSGNTVTISAWLRNDTAKANTAALYFGTQGPAPVHYWLLNPSYGKFKSVITNGTDAVKPWNTEIGLSDTDTTGLLGKWANYTTVIDATSITGYLNGVKVSEAKRSADLTLAGFGETLETYIGRSNYAADKTWGGAVQDVRFYDSALDQTQVREVFADARTDATKQAVARKAADSLDLGDLSDVTSNLTLPTAGDYGSTIAWRSSAPDVIAADGTVTRGTRDATVTLTATVGFGGQTATREFEATVPANTTSPAEALDDLDLPYVLAAGDTLPAKSGAVALSWTSSDDTLVKDGKVIGNTDGKGLADVTLTVTATHEGQPSNSRTYNVKIAERHAVYGASYTIPGSNLNRKASMHLALSDDGKTYEALNLNEGVLYAAADFTGANELNGRAKWMSNPYVFRMKDGTFGVLANQTDAKSNKNTETPDPAAKGKALFFTSDDLIAYKQVGLVTFDADGGDVIAPTAQYDSALGAYRVTWKDADGNTYRASTKDFAEVTAGERVADDDENKPDIGVADALVGGRFVLTRAEAKRLRARFLQAVNTGSALS